MVKFDPEGFAAMMARINEEERSASPYEDLEPDYEYMLAPWCDCKCH
ncbi:hypothetical protein [Arthrobacter sp. HMWF013]|nr:hypothetical protein [Arthrobacter sp. HMWF013]